jgi:hypothetical protein
MPSTNAERARKYARAHPERAHAAERKWRQAHLAEIREADRLRRQDPVRRAKRALRQRVRVALLGIAKSAPTMVLVGCTPDQLRAHLEAQFEPGMSWENYGLRGWHIDHIRPCADFDLMDPEQQRQCFHYTNLQPLWAEDNIQKGARYER